MAMLDQLWRGRPDTLAAHLDPGFKRYRHSRLLSKVFRDLAYDDTDRFQIVTTQPRIGKTYICSEWGPTWLLDEDPAAKIMLLSYTIDLARRNAVKVRARMRMHKTNLRTSLAPDVQTAHHWETPEGGFVHAAGVGGAVTGFGANLIIIDDPHKNRREADSELKRRRVWEWWQDDVSTRLEKSEDGERKPAVLIVMTRWHPDDLVGRLLKEQPDKWKVTALPARAEPHITGVPDPLGRQPGEVVCPEMFDDADLAEREELAGPRAWASLYQCRPSIEEGAILKRDWWEWEPAMLSPHLFDMLVTSWDLTFTDEGDSWTVGQVWAKTRTATTEHYWLLDQVRGKWDFVEQKRAILGLATKWPRATHHLIERAANGAAMLAELRSSTPLLGLVGINPSTGGSKTDRARAITPLLEGRRVHIPGWVTTGDMRSDGSFSDSWVEHFVDECANFPKGTDDDQVDACTQALRWLSDPVGAGPGSTGVGSTRNR